MKELLVVFHLINNVGICRETVENLTKWGNVKESEMSRNKKKKYDYYYCYYNGLITLLIINGLLYYCSKW